MKAIKILGLLGFSLLASSHLSVVEEIKTIVYPSINTHSSLVLDIKQKRYALVIGNSLYSKYLQNPIIDAKAVAVELEKLGFEVILKTNVNQKEMEDALDLFHRKLTFQSIGLFYYAGHGVQIGGVNYLVPLKANINKQADVKYKAVDIGLVLDSMGDDREGFNIVILDACRDNPLTRSFSRSLIMNALGGISHKIDGTLIAYATASGKVAKDGSGQHSPYTKSFLKHLPTPDLSIEEFFKRVSRDVKLVTNKEQRPWISSSFSGSFSFMPTIKNNLTPVQQQPNVKPNIHSSKLSRNIIEDKSFYGQRTALVIGNNIFNGNPRILKNAINDAKDIASSLERKGFNVTLLLNTNRKHMLKAMYDLSKKAGVKLFYFAGFSFMHDGENYIIPTDFNNTLENNAINIKDFRSNQLKPSYGNIFAYATLAGHTALDGKGRNGLYTKHLLNLMNNFDEEIQSIFQKVRIAVEEESHGKQTPVELSTAKKDFYFLPSKPNTFEKDFFISILDGCRNTPFSYNRLNTR